MKKLAVCLFTLAVLQGCGGGRDAADAASPEGAGGAPGNLVQGTYRFDGRQPQTVTFEDLDGWAYFQGDIILGRTADLVAGRAQAQHAEVQGDYTTTGGRWLNGVLVYDAMAMTTGTRANLRTAFRHLSSLTPVRFTRDMSYASFRNSANGPLYDWVRMTINTDPRLAGSSSVGRVGGGQPFTLSDGPPGNRAAAVAVHELMHALGAWHEQSRTDRDTYVRVNTANIDPSMLYNFDKHVSDGATHGGYDYCSVTHYDRYAFSVNNQPTLEAKNPVSCTITRVDGSGTAVSSAIGQRDGASSGDTAMVKALYAGAPANRPHADAGDDQFFKGPFTTSVNVQLDARGSRAYGGASIAKYHWCPLDVGLCCTDPRASGGEDCASNPISNYAGPVATITQTRDPKLGSASRQYRLTVIDSAGRQMSDVVTVTMSN